MSSQPESSTGHKETATKKARPRACDQCRRRKVRCNGGEIPTGNPCANCVSFDYECTYVQIANSKQVTDHEYVKGLEDQVAELKKQLRMYSEQPSNQVTPVTNLDDTPTPGSSPVNHTVSTTMPPVQPTVGSPNQSEYETDDYEGVVELLQSMNLNVKHTHFLGRSSSMTFVRAALAIRQEYLGPDQSENERHRDGLEMHQPEFWDATARLIRPDPPHPPSAFPPPALLCELVDQYFNFQNNAYPLLHRPIFDRDLRTGLHLKDEAFGSTVLLVCAVGARFSTNPAVFPEGTKSWHWAGWKWFQQVNLARKFVHISAPRVYDLQVCALFAWYISMSPVPHAVYSVVGYAVRLAKDLGIHRRGTYGPRLTVEDELKKRAFWCLVAFDRTTSDKMGRPYNVYDEDFDVDFPIECDEEYWLTDGPELVFAQPPDKPSKIAAFNCMLRLTCIHAEAFRIMYHLHPSRIDSDQEQLRVQKVVSELDSKLNEFIDSVPEHLKWNPNQENTVFMSQSALIYTNYYFLQIITHRSFVPLPQRPLSVSSFSLAICTNAARCCIHIVDTQIKRTGTPLFPQPYWHPLTLFTSATVLLLNVRNAKKSGIATESSGDLKEVQKANKILQIYEERWLGAARLWYILRDVISVVTKSPPRGYAQRKRKRNEASADDSAKASSSFASIRASEPQVQQPQFVATMEPTEQPYTLGMRTADFDFALPVHSNELGRFPTWPTLGSTVTSTSSTVNEDAWSMPGVDPFMASEGPLGVDQPQPDIDPELEAIFANLFPDVGYGGTFSSFHHGGAGSFDVPWTSGSGFGA